VPGILLLPMAIVFFILLRDSPEQAGFRPVRDDLGDEIASGAANSPAAPSGWASTWQILAMTLSNRILWVLAIGFFVMNAVRYSFMNWSVQYMADFHGRSIRNSALTAIMIPLIGSLGALSAGWAS